MILLFGGSGLSIYHCVIVMCMTDCIERLCLLLEFWRLFYERRVL